MMMFILFLISINTDAISFKNSNEKKNTDTPAVKVTQRTKKDFVRTKSSAIEKDDFKEKLTERNQEYTASVNDTLEKYYNVPIVLERKINIKTLDTFKGFLPDSLILTSTPSELVVKSIETDGPLSETKLRCLGSVVLQRAKIYCDLMVNADKEVRVKVLIREDHDGSSTLLPDKYYTGEEARFIKQSFSAMFAGAMDASKERVLTDRGQEDLVNSKNKIYEGLFGVGQNAQRELRNESGNVEIVAVVNSGRRVRIEFLEGVRNE